MLAIVGMPSSEMRCSKTSRRRASLRPSEPLRSADSGGAEVHADPVRAQRHSDVADPRAGRHAGDVGHGQQLSRSAVEARAGRSDPHRDRDRRLRDALQQLLDLVTADDGAARVDLQDERLRALLVGAGDRLVDGVDHDRVDQSADLQHIDGPRGLVALRGGRRAERGQPRTGRRRWPAGRSLVCAQVPPESVDPVPLLSASRVTIVAGKGGVGKTTVTAVLARAAADAGQRVLVVELDGKPVLGELVDGLPFEPISASAALAEYLRDHGFGRIAKRLSTSGVIDVVATAAPGIDDIVVLGKIKQLERSGKWDVIVVDGPAAGHAVTFLTSAAGLRESVRSGPVRTQAEDVLELLNDPARAQVVLVTLPETTPVNEVVETAYALEDRVGVRLGPVVVNGVDDSDVELPDAEAAVAIDDPDRALLIDAARFRQARRDLQATEIERLRARTGVGAVAPAAAARGGDGVSRRRGAGGGPAGSGVRGAASDSMAPVLDGAEVVVCCGSGGVGKTTTAAVIGLHAARTGRRVVVVTIDPARRLADALGLPGGLAAEPQRIDLAAIGGARRRG